jgi:hypothetical protein
MVSDSKGLYERGSGVPGTTGGESRLDKMIKAQRRENLWANH